VKTATLAVYTRQLAVMVRSGIALLTALEGLTRGEDKVLNEAFDAVANRVRTGSYLSQALAAFPQLFPAFYLGIVQVGERSGSLSLLLDRLSDNLERSTRLRRRLLSALTYPLVLITTSIGLLTFLLAYILPLMEPLFAQVGGELPLLTRACLALAHALQKPQTWAMLLLAGIALGIVGNQIAHAEPHSPLKRSRDRFLLRLPGIGGLLKLATLGGMLRLFALLLAAGVEIRSALGILRSTVVFEDFQDALLLAEEALTEGDSLAEALGRGEAFPRGCLQMIMVAEESGRMDKMLDTAASLYEDAAEHLADTLVDLLEPLLLCVASVLVGVVCVAVLLPWLTLLSKLS
jgi:type II secretory pathway component PulF